MERSGKQHKNLENLFQHINTLIDRQALVASLVDKQEMHRHDLVQSLVQREKYSELRRQVDQLHPADIAFVLENLPLDRRRCDGARHAKKKWASIRYWEAAF